jgi:fibronectin-binding autotransporter adhesin
LSAGGGLTGSEDAGGEDIGVYGAGTFIQTGGTNSAHCLHLGGYGAGSTGIYNLSGTGLLSSPFEQIGRVGTGTFTQTGGTNSITMTGTSSDYGLVLGQSSGSNGTYNLNGGTLILKTLGKGSGTATFNFGGGTLQASGDFACSLPMTLTGTGGAATVDTQSYAVTFSGSLSGDGGLTKLGLGTLALTGTNSYVGLTTVKSGTLELGASAQGTVLTLGGANVQGGKIFFNYPSQAAAIQADLKTSYTTGFALTNGSKFHSSTATSLYGLGWADDGSSKVTVAYTLYGDANLDYTVNGSDLNTVLSNYNQSSIGWGQGDFNYDGTVNGSDLNVVLSNYNQSLSVGAAVPEPTAIGLLAGGAICLLAYAWRRRA